jgi:hypothetical protein
VFRSLFSFPVFSICNPKCINARTHVNLFAAYEPIGTSKYRQQVILCCPKSVPTAFSDRFQRLGQEHKYISVKSLMSLATMSSVKWCSVHAAIRARKEVFHLPRKDLQTFGQLSFVSVREISFVIVHTRTELYRLYRLCIATLCPLAFDI